MSAAQLSVTHTASNSRELVIQNPCVASFQRAVSIPLYDEEIVRIKVAELI